MWIIRNLLQKPPRFEFGVLLWGAYVQVGWSAHQEAYGLQSFTFIKKISEEHIQNQEEEEKKETGINWVILKSGHKGCLGRWGQLLCNCQALVMPVKIRWIFLSAQTVQVLVFYNYPKMLTLPLAT